MEQAAPQATAMAPPEPSRRAYRGSCHCGHTKYLARLTLPPEDTTNNYPDAKSTVRLRKCNCSSCHKMGFFHVRLKDMPNDFLLLSPLDPQEGGLSNYTCFEGRINWYFCARCGVRCFAFSGTGEVQELDLGTWTGAGPEGKMSKVWQPRPYGWTPEKGAESEEDSGQGWNAYLSVNAHTLEPGQEGLDLRDWVENKWVCYLDCKDEEQPDRYGKPHEGGTY